MLALELAGLTFSIPILPKTSYAVITSLIHEKRSYLGI